MELIVVAAAALQPGPFFLSPDRRVAVSPWSGRRSSSISMGAGPMSSSDDAAAREREAAARARMLGAWGKSSPESRPPRVSVEEATAVKQAEKEAARKRMMAVREPWCLPSRHVRE